jgi:cyclopropane fatty-acyl-phospholipid synthase-like methyltransferase
LLTSRNLGNAADIVQWTARLDREWPERPGIIRHIIDQIGTLPFPAIEVVELGSGAGQLAEALLSALPQVRYTGLDRSELLVTYGRERLASFGHRVAFLQANLNEAAWLEQAPEQLQAVVSMQSLHDLGGEAEVERIYGLSKDLLASGGLFLNADLVVPPSQDKPDNPGRRSIPRHLELLQRHGYQRVACTLAQGEFGCFVAFAP